MKATVLAQWKTALANRVRLSWNDTAESLCKLKQFVLFEQKFLSDTASHVQLHKKINGRPSVVLTSQLACQVAKLAQF